MGGGAHVRRAVGMPGPGTVSHASGQTQRDPVDSVLARSAASHPRSGNAWQPCCWARPDSRTCCVAACARCLVGGPCRPVPPAPQPQCPQRLVVAHEAGIAVALQSNSCAVVVARHHPAGVRTGARRLRAASSAPCACAACVSGPFLVRLHDAGLRTLSATRFRQNIESHMWEAGWLALRRGRRVGSVHVMVRFAAAAAMAALRDCFWSGVRPRAALRYCKLGPSARRHSERGSDRWPTPRPSQRSFTQ